MSPADVQALRESLACSVGELAAAVGVEVKTVMAWEAGDLFPTKRHAVRLEALKNGGPSAVSRKPRGHAAPTPGAGLGLLADPRLWAIVRKLLAHPELFGEVEKLANRFDDPVPPTKA